MYSRACIHLRVYVLQWQVAESRMRLIKFAGFLVEVQCEAFVRGSHQVVEFSASFCVCTLVVIQLQRESPRALYLLIQLFGSLLDCRSDAVRPMRLLLTSTCRFQPSISSHHEPVCSAGGKGKSVLACPPLSAPSSV